MSNEDVTSASKRRSSTASAASLPQSINIEIVPHSHEIEMLIKNASPDYNPFRCVVAPTRLRIRKFIYHLVDTAWKKAHIAADTFELFPYSFGRDTPIKWTTRNNDRLAQIYTTVGKIPTIRLFYTFLTLPPPTTITVDNSTNIEYRRRISRPIMESPRHLPQSGPAFGQKPSVVPVAAVSGST